MRSIFILEILMIPSVLLGQKDNTKPCNVLKGHEQKVPGSFFSPNGNFIKSYGWGITDRIWDINTRLKRVVYAYGESKYESLGLSPDWNHVSVQRKRKRLKNSALRNGCNT